MCSEESTLVLETIHSALVGSDRYSDIQTLLRDVAILAGNFKYSKREIPQLYTVYSRLLTGLAAFPIETLSLEQWELLVECLCKDEQLDKGVYELKEEENKLLRPAGEGSEEAEYERRKDLRRKNRLHLMEKGIISKILSACFHPELVQKSQTYLSGQGELPAADEGFMNRCKVVMTLVVQDWKDIPFELELVKTVVVVSLAYMKRYIQDKTDTYNYAVGIHGNAIEHYFAVRELPTERDEFTDLLVKGYTETLREGVTDDPDRFLHIVDFFLELLPWLPEQQVSYEVQLWDCIETIATMVEGEFNGKADGSDSSDGEAAKAEDSSEDWLNNLFETVPVDLDRQHANEMSKNARVQKLRVHICSLLKNLSAKSVEVEAAKVKRILQKLCDLSSTDLGSTGDIQAAFERTIKIGAISDDVQRQMIDECLALGLPQAEQAVTNIVTAAPERLRNELAEKVFRFFIDKLKTKHNEGEKHSFSLSDLLLCRNARLAMVSSEQTCISLFCDLLTYFNHLCSQKRIAPDPLIDEIMSLMHILFAGASFLEDLKHCTTRAAVEYIKKLPEAVHLTPVHQMHCPEAELSRGFRNFAHWSLSQPGDLCPPYIYPVFTAMELEERDDPVVLAHLFRLLPYWRSQTGSALFRRLYPKDFVERLDKYFAAGNIEALFMRILVLFTEDIRSRTGKMSSMESHYILSFFDAILVAISSDMSLSPKTIELLRDTLKQLDLYELSLACARWNYRGGLIRLSCLFKIYRNSLLNEAMPFQRMVDDCVHGQVVDMMHNDKKKTISPAYTSNTFKLSYDKLDCVLSSSDEPTAIEGIIECIRSELCTFLFDQFDPPNSSTAIQDEMVKFCIEVASSAQYAIVDAETANTYLNLMIPDSNALHHVYLMETILAVATSIEASEPFEIYPLSQLFGDVVGELFCSEMYTKKWMKQPPMAPLEKYLDLCATGEDLAAALNPSLVASFSSILDGLSPTEQAIKAALGSVLSQRLHLLPLWINNSLYPAITLAEFRGIFEYLEEEDEEGEEEDLDKLAAAMSDCVEKVIRESVTTELAEYRPIEVQSTDRFAQSWLCSRRKKEPKVYAHYKLTRGKVEMRKYFEEAMVLLCEYGKESTHEKIAKACTEVLGNWCGLTGTEEKVVRGETMLQDNPQLLFRLSVANTLLQYMTELFTNIGGNGLDGYYSDLEPVKDLVMKRGVQAIPVNRLEVKGKNSTNLCSYTTTEAKYIQQHWYNCYTCNFVGQTGCCSICVVNCHRGHDIVYSKHGSFFCDCGAKKCFSMKSTSHLPMPNAAARGRKLALLNAAKCDEPDEAELFSFPQTISSQRELFLPFLSVLKDKLTENAVGIENAVRASVDAHINTYDIESKRTHVLESLSSVEGIKMVTDQPVMDVLERESRMLTNLVPRRQQQQQSQEHMEAGQRPKDMCGRVVLETGRQLWIMLEGSSFTVHHISQGDSIVEELNTARQETEQLSFSARRMSCCEDKAVILGRNEALLLRFGGDGEIRDKTSLSIGEIAAHGNNPFSKAVWAPKRTGTIAIATAQYVRVFDISVDTTNHLEELVLPVGNIQDIALLDDQGSLMLLVFSTAGHLYRHQITAQLPQNNSIFLTNTLNMPPPQAGAPVSFHYSPASRLMFISYENSSWFGVVPHGNLRAETMGAIEWRKIPSEHAFSCWQEASGILAAMNHQGGFSVTYFYPTCKQLIMQKVDSHKRTPFAHLLYTSPSNTTVNALLFYPDAPHFVPLTSHWASLPDLWIDGLPLEFSTTMEMVKEDVSEDLGLDDLITMMECCEPIERVEVTSTDLLRFYDAQDISSRLQNVGTLPVTVLQSCHFSVSLRCTDSNYIARAVRIEVPEVKGPQKVVISGRTVALSTTTARFFDIPLTRAETLQMETVPLSLTFTGRDNYVVVTSCRLYGIRRRDFGFPTPQLSSKAPLSLPEEHLKHMLKLLHVMADNKQIVGNPNWLTKITEQLVSIRSTNKEVYTAANALLRVLFADKPRRDYYDLKDGILYEDLLHLTDSPHPLPGIIVERLVTQVKMILATRSDRFFKRLSPVEAVKLLGHLRRQLRLQSVDDSLKLIEIFCLLSFVCMGGEKEQRESVFDAFLAIFLDQGAIQHASVVRVVALTLINSFALTTHADRQKLAGSTIEERKLLRHGGLLPYYGKSTILTKDDAHRIPKDAEMMGPAVPYNEIRGTNMYDQEASHLVELLRRVLLKIRDEGVVSGSARAPTEPVPTFQLVMFAYSLLHNLCPDKILPIIVELIEMVDWKATTIERSDGVCRQFLLFRLVVLFLTRCTEYTETKRQKKKAAAAATSTSTTTAGASQECRRASREQSMEPEPPMKAPPSVFDKFEELGKKESYEKLLYGIAQKLIDVNCLDYCWSVLKMCLKEWRGPAQEQAKTTGSSSSGSSSRTWGRYSGDHLLESIKTDDNHRDHFFGTIMQLALRLPLQMRRVNPKLFFADWWTELLCEITSVPYPSTIRQNSRKLLLLLAGNDRAQYKSVRDLYLMRNYMSQLREKFKEQMSHKELTEIVDIIAGLSTTATDRPAMWRNICEEHLTWMLTMVTQVADAVTTNVLELLVAAIRVETSVEESQHIANRIISVDENREALKLLLRRFLVGRDENRRWLAHGLIRSTILLASRTNQMTIIRIMWYELWPEARESGANGAQLADLLATYLPRVFNTNELMNVCDIEMKAIMKQSDTIINEGHNSTYEMMTELGLGWNFMLMVSNPCLNCFSKKRTSETMKLSSIKQDMRFSSNAQMVKLIGFYEVSRVIVKLSDVKRAKTVKKVSVFYCPKVVDSPVELKTKPELWQLAGSTSVMVADNEMIVSLSVPVVTSTLIIQFTELAEARHTNELQCPRCSSIVQPNPGVCENCGENAYQCFKCRSINYDDKDPFLCQHCGFCKYARIDASVVCRPLPRVQPILTDADRTAAVDHMSQLLVDVEQSRSQMLIGRGMCESLWLHTRPLPAHSVRAEGNHIAEMAVAGMPIIPINEHGVYCVKEIINYCTLAHDELCSQTQQLLAYRDELLQYDGCSKSMVGLLANGFYNTSTSCFGCLTTGIRHSIAILQGACDDPLATQKILATRESYMEIVHLGADYEPLRADVESFMCRVAFENEAGSRLLCEQVEVGWLPGTVLAKSLTQFPDSFWEMKLRSLMRTAVEKDSADTVISTLQVLDRILLESGAVRRRAYRKLQYGENDPSEDVPQRRVNIVNRHVDNRSKVARWMNKKGSWEECEKTTEAPVQEDDDMLVEIEDWLWQCLFSQWTMVRSTAAKLLHNLAKQPGYLGTAIRIIIRGISTATATAPQQTEQFFHAIHNILNRRKHLKMRLYLHGLHIYLLNQIHEESRRLYRAEHSGDTIDHGNGIILRDFIEVLVSLFCGDSSEGFLLKAAVPHIMTPLLQSTIFLKRLLLHRTRSTDICRHALELLLRKVSSKEPLMLMHTAVEALDDPVDQFTQAQIFSVIMEVLAPERHKDEGFLIQIEKDPAQEDFLQGRMTGNPYRSSDPGLGPLMRDIKNKICRDTEMITLLEDDNGMELLVNNQIISLSLPVSRVYEKLWHRDHPGQPLTIVYRMRGLMGDAVEQFIETLGTAEEQSAEDTALSALVEQFVTCGGITRTLLIVEHCDISTGGRILLGSVLSLLERVSKSERGRGALVQYGGIRVFTKILRECVESRDDSMMAIGKEFLKLLDVLVRDISTHEHLHDLTAEDARWLIRLALERNVKERQLSEDVAKLLGNLILGNDEAEEVLVTCCQETLRWCIIDTTTDVAKRKEIVEAAEILCEIVAGILPSQGGNRLKDKIVSSGCLSEACGYLLNSHPPLYSATESQEWKTFLMRPSLRLMLTFMNSMVRSHVGSQQALSEQSLPLLHRLEQVASDNSIGTLAENVMEALKENAEVAKKIEAVRLETKQKKRQMAMAMRNKQLSKMGMQIGKQGEVKIAARKIANEPHLEEVIDPQTACCICREPILAQGDKAAAVYAFASLTNCQTKLNLLTSVSQMVLVHIDCHMTAVRRSGGGRNADEWSKAMLHNAGARCNILTPLAINEGPFQQALARYQTDLDVLTSTPAVTRGLVFMDMCFLIDRFVNFTSFSEKSQGGGRESNAQYLGVLHLLACSLPATDELRTLLPQWCVYSFLLTEETLEQWRGQRADVLDVALKNCPQGAGPGGSNGWSAIRTTCLAWAFVDLYYRDVVQITGERVQWLREHFVETTKKSTQFVQKFDNTVAPCPDFGSFAEVMDLQAADFREALEMHQQAQ